MAPPSRSEVLVKTSRRSLPSTPLKRHAQCLPEQ